MRAGFNIFWFLLGGGVTALAWCLASVVLACTVAGFPWARAALAIGGFVFQPFGQEIIRREELLAKGDHGKYAPSTAGKILWLLLAGWWLALAHGLAALLNFPAMASLPFAAQHLKLAGLALAPLGQTIVTKERAAQARTARAQAQYLRFHAT